MAVWRCWLEPAAAHGRKKADLVLSVNVNLSAEGGGEGAEREKVEAWFEDAVRSLRIADWGLFGDSDE
jgi:hypothetical protein